MLHRSSLQIALSPVAVLVAASVSLAGGQGCLVDCTSGSLAEPEACGADANHGCDATPYVFTDVACPAIICGTAWADGGQRDADWYRISVTDPDGDGFATVNATLTSGFPGVVRIRQDACPDPAIWSEAFSTQCAPATAAAYLPAPGTYLISVRPETTPGVPVVAGYPCATSDNDYVLEIACSTCPQCIEPPADMIAWWPLDETTGDVAAELVQGADGQWFGGPTPDASGYVDGSLCFGGTGFVQVTTGSNLFDFGTGDFSIEAWVFWDTAYGAGPYDLVSKIVGPLGYRLYVVNDCLAFTIAGGVFGASWFSFTDLTDGWHHVAVTVDRDTPSGGWMYIDGVQLVGINPIQHQASIDNTAPFVLSNLGSESLPGCLDEVALYDRVLTPAEVQAIHAAGRAGKCKPDSGDPGCIADCNANETEPELCCQDVNHGCDLPPYIFTDVACPTTICGTAWAFDGARDSDWYRFDVTDDDDDGLSIITVGLTSEFPGVVRLHPETCPDPPALAQAYSSDCMIGVASICVAAPGTYLVSVRPETADGYLCSSGSNDYLLNLNCGPCTLTCVQPPPDMIGWWPLDEGTGPEVAELVNGIDALWVGDPVPDAAAYVNGSLCFDTTNLVLLGNLPSLDVGTGDLSIDLWMKWQAGGPVGYMVQRHQHVDDDVFGYSLYMFDDSPGLLLADGTFANFIAPVTLGSGWHFVAVTVDRDSPTGGVFYVDGTPVHVFDPTSHQGSLDAVGTLGFLGPNLQGCLDEVEIFDRALTANEVQAIYSAGALGKCHPNPCPADLDGDGSVGTSDLLLLLAAWGPCSGCPADLDGNGIVGTSDILLLLASWGPCDE